MVTPRFLSDYNMCVSVWCPLNWFQLLEGNEYVFVEHLCYDVGVRKPGSSDVASIPCGDVVVLLISNGLVD